MFLPRQLWRDAGLKHCCIHQLFHLNTDARCFVFMFCILTSQGCVWVINSLQTFSTETGLRVCFKSSYIAAFNISSSAVRDSARSSSSFCVLLQLIAQAPPPPVNSQSVLKKDSDAPITDRRVPKWKVRIACRHSPALLMSDYKTTSKIYPFFFFQRNLIAFE